MKKALRIFESIPFYPNQNSLNKTPFVRGGLFYFSSNPYYLTPNLIQPPHPISIHNMTISKRLLKYFNRKKSDSTDKNHTRYRNDICNHWDLDYMSIEEIDRLLEEGDVETTITRKKKED